MCNTRHWLLTTASYEPKTTSKVALKNANLGKETLNVNEVRNPETETELLELRLFPFTRD